LETCCGFGYGSSDRVDEKQRKRINSSLVFFCYFRICLIRHNMVHIFEITQIDLVDKATRPILCQAKTRSQPIIGSDDIIFQDPCQKYTKSTLSSTINQKTDPLRCLHLKSPVLRSNGILTIFPFFPQALMASPPTRGRKTNAARSDNRLG